MYYTVSEIYIVRRFLKNCCYFEQVIFVADKESLIPYNLIQTAQKTQTFNTVTSTQIKQI